MPSDSEFFAHVSLQHRRPSTVMPPDSESPTSSPEIRLPPTPDSLRSRTTFTELSVVPAPLRTTAAANPPAPHSTPPPQRTSGRIPDTIHHHSIAIETPHAGIPGNARLLQKQQSKRSGKYCSPSKTSTPAQQTSPNRAA